MEKLGRGLLYQLLAALMFITTLILIRASIEAGMNDDWSYIRTVHDLAQTGQLRYNGWSAPLIGFQAYWGTLFVKIFGFSFFVVRASIVVLSVFSIPVLWSVLRSVGMSETQAFFGLLAFLFSPLNLPNLATFMTDMPAFLLFAAALLSALKAWESSGDRRAMLWIFATTLLGFLSGSVRQIYWMGSICLLVVLAVMRFRAIFARLVLAACVVTTLLVASACSQWLAAQPYVPAEGTIQAWRLLRWDQIAKVLNVELVRACIGTALMSLPFNLLLAPSAARRLPFWMHLLVVPIAIVIAYRYAHPLPWLGNTLTEYGVLLPTTVSVGERPGVLSPALIVILAAIGLAVGFYAGCSLLRQLTWKNLAGTGLGRFLALTAPFVIGYVFVLALRAPGYGLYDRYLIPLVFVESIAVLGIYARSNSKISRLGLSAAALFAAYAIATTHDYFAEARAKLAATAELLDAGIGRESILSGFEFDLWTETDRTGHVNNKLVKFPANAYRLTEDCDGEDDTAVWWREIVPDLSQRYVVSISYLDDLRTTKFPPIAFWRWLPPTRSNVYVEEVDPAYPPLSCQPGSGQ